MNGSATSWTRGAASLVGLLGLILVGLGIFAFVQALFATRSMQFGLVIGPVLAVAGLPALVAARRLWREGRGWWLAALWSGVGLIIGAVAVWNEWTQPGAQGPSLGIVLWTAAFAVSTVALLIARVR
jgi:hypothetical protein